LNYSDVAAAHPSVLTARDALLDPTRTDGPKVSNVALTQVNRTVWFIAQHYPGVHPDELGTPFAEKLAAFVRGLHLARSANYRLGARLLFETLEQRGLRDVRLPNPFPKGDAGMLERRQRSRVRRPLPQLSDEMPAALRGQCEQLKTYLTRQIEIKDEGEGHGGLSLKWCEEILTTLNDLCRFMTRHNAAASADGQWPIDLRTIYGRPEIIAEYLVAGESNAPTRAEHVKRATRNHRKNRLMRAHR